MKCIWWRETIRLEISPGHTINMLAVSSYRNITHYCCHMSGQEYNEENNQCNNVRGRKIIDNYMEDTHKAINDNEQVEGIDATRGIFEIHCNLQHIHLFIDYKEIDTLSFIETRKKWLLSNVASKVWHIPDIVSTIQQSDALASMIMSITIWHCDTFGFVFNNW